MNWSPGPGKGALALALLRGTFAWLEPLSPSLAARLARRLFLTPPARRRPSGSAELARLRSGERLVVPALPGIVVRSWGQGPAVLLVHGWGGRSGQLCGFVAPLVDAGYRVVALDGPAHGESPGKRTDMISFADTVAALATRLQADSGLHAVVGHSFGAACSLYALRDTPQVKLVLISCPPHAIWATERFGAALAVSPGVLARMRTLIEHEHQQRFRWADLSLVALASRRNEVLLVHDEHDRLIPYQESAAEFLRVAPWLEHLATQGLGHRSLLAAPAVIARVREFLARPAAARQHAAGLLEATP